MSELDKKPCPKCGEPAGQIINAQSNRRVGWWCQACNTFDDAIGRERVLEKDRPVRER